MRRSFFFAENEVDKMKKVKNNILTIEEAEKVSGVHYTLRHTGKMAGMMSLSTSCTMNKNCLYRSKNPKTVCSHCYAQRQLKIYKTLEKCLIKNTEILTGRVLEDRELPIINALYFRLESFGDLNNTTQVINYFNLCKKNKNVRFALWTKNLWLIESVLNAGVKKPSNLQIIYSLPILNDKNETIFAWYPFVDKVFTVFTKDYIKENNIEINCGAESCLKCAKCYKKNNVKYINEQLK
nr:MAG TPA: hypothetical protein [Caudoviricetes sp.]